MDTSLAGLALALALSCASCGGGRAAGPDATLPGSDAGQLPDGGPDAAAGAIWHPRPGTSWQWQLSGTIDETLQTAMYDLDLFDAPDAVIKRLQARGVKVICYFSAGSHENWRADAADFPAAVLGQPLDGWPGERWLDIRAAAVRTRMAARLEVARTRGCDGVEPDNIDGYDNPSGFPLSAADQLDFNRFLAREAHARGLSIGLKNDLQQVAALQPDFDWALDEECMRDDECDQLRPFIAANKAVFHVEYGDATLARTVCPDANARNFDTLIKNLELDSFRIACR